MEFTDTIAALSTPSGRGAVCILRLSGPGSLPALNLFCKTFSGIDFASAPRRAIRVLVLEQDGTSIDDGLALYFPGPHSFTGEDCAELQLHGSPLIARRVLFLLSERCGIRPALPGEFTRRAFRNGKMDLTEAESIRRLIEARSEYELASARRLYSGELKKSISRMRSSLINLKAETEAEVDFSEEDLTFESKEAKVQHVREIIASIDDILSRSGAAQRVSDGFRVALAGVTNAGKSSLLNRMLGWDRSIVSDIHGTTRDYVSEDVELGDYRVRFIDTAGLRKTDDPLEKEGIRRSLEELRRSQLILHVIDASRPAYDFLPELEAELNDSKESRKILHILNKEDARAVDAWTEASIEARTKQKTDAVRVSCRTGDGIEALKQRVLAHLEEEPGARDPFLLEERHRHHFQATRKALGRLLDLWSEKAPEEIAAIEIDEALKETAAITGEITTEDVLGRIFSMFCIGK